MKKQTIKYLKYLIPLLIIGIYYLIVHPLLKKSMLTAPFELTMAGILIIVLLASIVITLCLLIIMGVVLLRTKSSTKIKKWSDKLLRHLKMILISSIYLITLVFISQKSAYTPPILDQNGDPISGSIATIEKVNINGTDQYLTIRSKNIDKPVLLFLAGGPGGTQLSPTREYLKRLEDHFVVVNWEQPGSGKSFSTSLLNSITPEQYVEDGHEVTKYLLKRFHQEKIYVVGQSWGTVLGLWLVKQYPENYYAYIGAGQMVDFVETDIECYNTALQIAKEKGDDATVNKLEKQGPPPYPDNVTMKSATFLMYLFNVMNSNPKIAKSNHDTFVDIAAPEYGLLDKVNYFRGILYTFDHVYPQLYDVDLRNDAIKFEVPIYIFHGRYDLNASTKLAYEYYQMIDAPSKEFTWFEHSGHDLWIEENELFMDKLIEISTLKTSGIENE